MNERINTCVVKPRDLNEQALNVQDFPLGSRSDFFLQLFEWATGAAVRVPFIVARGAKPGPVLGLSAAVHGNELNGIKIIHRLLAEVNLSKLRGSLLCAPVVNVPGFCAGKRYFTDGVDLNHVFPGSSNGPPSSQFAQIFSSVFLPPCDCLVDIHTASEGRINTMYVRADLKSRKASKLAFTANPQIILHSKGGDGTFRAEANRLGIPSITMEAGNPSVFQSKMIKHGVVSIKNIMRLLDMISGQIRHDDTPIVCSSSQWIRTTGGGILETDFSLGEIVEKNQLLAVTRDPFGNTLQEYYAPHRGIVIGQADYPVAIPGTRFCHLGKLRKPRAK